MTKQLPTTHILARISLVLVGLLTLFSLVLGRFFILQVLDGEQWKEKADKQHLLKLREPFYRGRFLLHESFFDQLPDTQTILSCDVTSFSAYLDTKAVKEPIREEIVNYLKTNSYLDTEQAEKIQKSLKNISRSRRVLNGLSLERKNDLQKFWNELAKKNHLERNALFFVQTHRRSHPNKGMLSYLVHTTQTQRHETTLQAEPTGGLESFFDSCLKGQVGKRILQRTLKRPLSSHEIYTPPIHGGDVTLTINPRLQAEAEAILESAIIRYQAKNAWAIAIDPYSGKILCLAQAPGFNPEEYWKAYNDPEAHFRTKIWGAIDGYEPGSVMKPLNIALALSANEKLSQQNQPLLFDPAYMLHLQSVKFPARRKPLKDVTFSRFCNMDMAIQRSSNLYMASVIQKLCDTQGATTYANAVRSLGFGELTGIEITSETSGLVPTPGKINVHGRLEWSAPTPVSMSMGHNILTTSFQLLRAYSALANGGWLIHPTLVESVYSNQNGKLSCDYQAGNDDRFSSPKVLSESVCKRILHAMSYTVKPPTNNTRADVPKYSVAAKTGTANKIHEGQYNPDYTLSTFIGVVPVHQPRIVLLVSIDEPKRFYIPGKGYNHRASFCVTPVFHHIMSKAVEILGIPPDYPEGYLPADPRFVPSKSYCVEENRLLQEIYDKWNSHPRAGP